MMNHRQGPWAVAWAILFLLLPGSAVLTSTRAATVTWDNNLLDGDDTNFNNAANWSGGSGVPGAADIATFTGAAIVNPNLTASHTVLGLNFSTSATSGYTLSATAGLLTLTSTSGGGSSAIYTHNTSGVNTISAPIILGGAVADRAAFNQSGGALVVSGDISSTNANTGLALGGGTFTLSGSNSYSGTTLLGGTLNLGSNSALGTSELNFASPASIILDAVGGDRTLTNQVKFSNSFTFAGTNNLTLGAVPSYFFPRIITLNSTTGKTLTFGTLTNSDVNGILTVNGTGNKLVLGGLQLASDTAGSARIFTIDGSATVEITGPVTNGTASFNHEMRYFGTGKIILSGASTYAGTTRVISGTMQLTGSLNPATYLRIGQAGTASGKFILGGASGAVTQTVSRFDNREDHGVLNVLSGGASTNSILTINSTTTDAFNGLVGGTGANENNIGITKSNTGTLTFTAPNTYTGGTIINGGTLLVTNTSGSGLGTGAVAVDGGTLGGTGAISGAVTVNSGGTLAPGASIESLDVGSLVLNTGSILSMELGAPGTSDLIKVTSSGGLNIAGGSVSLSNAGGLAAGTYTLVDYLDSFTGAVVNLGTPTGPAGFSYALQDNATNTSIDLVVTAIPEPSTWVLLFFAAMPTFAGAGPRAYRRG